MLKHDERENIKRTNLPSKILKANELDPGPKHLHANTPHDPKTADSFELLVLGENPPVALRLKVEPGATIRRRRRGLRWAQ